MSYPINSPFTPYGASIGGVPVPAPYAAAPAAPYPPPAPAGPIVAQHSAAAPLNDIVNRTVTYIQTLVVKNASTIFITLFHLGILCANVILYGDYREVVGLDVSNQDQASKAKLKYIMPFLLANLFFALIVSSFGALWLQGSIINSITKYIKSVTNAQNQLQSIGISTIDMLYLLFALVDFIGMILQSIIFANLLTGSVKTLISGNHNLYVRVQGTLIALIVMYVLGTVGCGIRFGWAFRRAKTA